jgi:hypothetical protein
MFFTEILWTAMQDGTSLRLVVVPSAQAALGADVRVDKPASGVDGSVSFGIAISS